MERSVSLICSEQVRAVYGVAESQALGIADELELDDVYCLANKPTRTGLIVAQSGLPGVMTIRSIDGKQRSERQLIVDCAITLMGFDGVGHTCLVLVEVDSTSGEICEIYIWAHGNLRPRAHYRLVSIDRTPDLSMLDALESVSFPRGTRVTLADGTLKEVENLRPGERILARSGSAVPLQDKSERLIRVQETTLAPVCIRAGALNNCRDLVLCPNHLVYDFQTSNLIVGRGHLRARRAADLVNGKSICRLDFHYLEVVSLTFSEPQIIFAEGVAVQSMPLPEVLQEVEPEDAAEQDTDVVVPLRRRASAF